MTTVQAPATTWHTNVHVNGEPYPTRNYTPNTDGLNYDSIGLTPQQANHLTAIHETGHAITALAGGGHLHYAQIGPVANNPSATADAYCCNLVDDNGHAQAIYYAAGERAADRWLRETGLWTPRRAVAAEVGAHGDRHKFLSINDHLVGYGDKPVDYRYVHDLADRVLDQNWDAITRVADALAQHQHLTGDAIADIAGLPNGTHFNL